MKASKTQQNTSSNSHSSKPFFTKEGEGSFFSQSKESEKPFFSSYPIQAKLSVGQPNDKYEQEADRVAEQVVRMPVSGGEEKSQGEVSPIQSKPLAVSSIRRMCSEWEEEQDSGTPVIQEKPNHSFDQGQSSAPNSVVSTIKSPGSGSPLSESVRSRVEPVLGADLSSVRVHTDSQSQLASRNIQAKAFTHGNNIFVGAGQSPHDVKLMAHEATHTVQQSGARPLSNDSIQMQCNDCEQEKQIHRKENQTISITSESNLIQKQDDPRRRRGGGGRRTPSTPAVQRQMLAYTIRDRKIGMGGTLVRDLTAFKRHIMRPANRMTGSWRLVLAIHGSEDRLAAQAGPNWQRNRVLYNAADIDALFSNDPAWVTWRDEHGPTMITLIGCQVSASLERTIINNLTRVNAQGRRQPNPGLGTGCVPLSRSESYHGRRRRINPDNPPAGLIERLHEVNSIYGYYGSPPVPNDQVLHFYMNEVPRNEWVIVEVGQETGDHEYQNTNIAFWNRSRGPHQAEFRQACGQVDLRLRGRQSTVPPSLD